MPIPTQSLAIKTVDGLTVYAVLRRRYDLGYWNTFTANFEALTTANWYSAGSNNYTKAATKTAQSANITAEYSITMFTGVPAGVYNVEWYSQQGANPAVSDPLLATTYDLLWNAVQILPLINNAGNAVMDGTLVNRPVTITPLTVNVTD